ncbi:hypothetical protein A6V39_02255 [Candidatus Mycoplasma haematobovis]|uniref:Uncharacterized protein n=1 Tax=Candidatus Mycoplasma haematobovis TaxID=432608 RepID=A0A1A9QDS2_9MOLU|nr:hypothetical protein [Candidatus Mycoplasma haematobovis]OAL10244.1 hypothetical protein A6V39_02255 [Candidatus Mycoplasma haematobovis]
MDNNQQEQESLQLERRKLEIPDLSSHPSYKEHGDDAIVDFSVDDIYDAFNPHVAVVVKQTTKAGKVVFECDDVINIASVKLAKKEEKKLHIDFDGDEIITVINKNDFEKQVAERGKAVFDKPVVTSTKVEKKEEEKEFVFNTLPKALFKGKLSEVDEAIYDSAFGSDNEIALIERRERAEVIQSLIEFKKEQAPIPEPAPDTPELSEVKSYLSTYPVHKVYRGIITEADDDYIPKDAYQDAEVLDEILGRSKEAAIEKAKREVALEFGKDVEDEELFNYARAPLASEEEIAELESKHMALYSSLSRIQEIQSANDFKSAYQIQDRISYLLNHRTLLYKSLTIELIKFIDSIIKKLDSYYEQASAKYEELKKYNEKISGIKSYKWKADESMKIIQENKEAAEREFGNL